MPRFTVKDFQSTRPFDSTPILAGVRNWILANPTFLDLFTTNPETPGDEISPSAKRPIDVFPFIELAHASKSPQLISDRSIIDTNDRVRVSLYTISYDNCYVLGDALNKWILSGHDQVAAENNMCTMIPATSNGPEREPDVEGMAGEVWCWHLEYFAVTGISIPGPTYS